MKSENGVVSSDEKRNGMSTLFTRGVFIKAAAASVVALALGLVKAQPAKAAIKAIPVERQPAPGAIVPTMCVIDFRNTADDKFIFKANVSEMMTSTSVDDFKITVIIERNGEPQQVWTGKPDVVR
ncbi:MAG: hypothetical protein HY665_03355 [Chloroflexi bacterium]|nr:hypothetical protein [Chloroflexota bacterium]